MCYSAKSLRTFRGKEIQYHSRNLVLSSSSIRFSKVSISESRKRAVYAWTAAIHARAYWSRGLSVSGLGLNLWAVLLLWRVRISWLVIRSSSSREIFFGDAAAFSRNSSGGDVVLLMTVYPHFPAPAVTLPLLISVPVRISCWSSSIPWSNPSK
jgi:hypothetical protein